MKIRKLTLILLADVFIGLIALAFIMVAMWNRPLGPSLAQSTASADQPENIPDSSALKNGDAVASQQLTPTPSSFISHITGLLSPGGEVVKTQCGGPPVMYILLIGSDIRSSGYEYGLSDSIRLVRVDFANPSVTMLDFPRDLWVEIPGIADHYDITHAKLNQAYFFGSPGMGYYDGPDGGPGLLAQTLQVNFGAEVDHYLAINMKTFERLVDRIDGIDIYISSKIDMNPEQDGANPDLVYEPGYYHLDGEHALALARDRNPTIFQRARYQTMVLNALEDKLLTPAMIPVWPQVIADFTDSVQTDLSPNEISQLICLAKLMNSDTISTVAFPDAMFASASTYDPYRKVYTYTLDADFTQIRSYVADFMNGTWH